MIETPSDPEGFKDNVFIAWGIWLERSRPFLEGGEDFGGISGAEFAAGAVAGAVFGEGEVFEEGGDWGVVDLGGLDEGAFRVGDAVNAAVEVVAEGIACAVLHVPDEDVVPIDEVE